MMKIYIRADSVKVIPEPATQFDALSQNRQYIGRPAPVLWPDERADIDGAQVPVEITLHTSQEREIVPVRKA